MQNILTKKITIIFAVLTVVGIAGVIVFERYISSLVDDIAVFQNEIRENEDTASVISLKRNIAELQQGIETLDTYLIDSDEVIGFIESIEDLGEKSGVVVEVQNINIEDVSVDVNNLDANGNRVTETVRSHGKLSVTVKTQSDWVSMMEMILLLQNMPFNLLIKDVRITSGGNVSSGLSQWNAVLNIVGVTN